MTARSQRAATLLVGGFLAFGFMMMPAPTGTKRAAFSSTVTGSLRNDSSRASERPPIPPPTTSVEMLTTAILLKVHGSVG